MDTAPAEKTGKAEEPRRSADELIAEAMRQPGITELMEVYLPWNTVDRAVGVYMDSISPVATVSLSNSSCAV